MFHNMVTNKTIRQLTLISGLFSVSLTSEAQRLEEITVIGVVPAGSSIDAKKLAFPIQTANAQDIDCLLYTSPSPRDGLLSRMPSSA